MTRLRLLGYPVSNYVNVVRAALLEKELPFEFVPTRASQDAAFRQLSPLGKIPVLETAAGCLTETVAILDYLDDAYPDIPLRPARAFERARARQMINIIQIYVEAQVRQLFPGLFMGGDNLPTTEASVRAMLDRATAALSQLLVPEPFLLGERPGQADLFAYYNLDIADRVTRFTYHRSLIEEIGGLEDWLKAMRARSSTRLVMAEFQSSFATYLADHGAAYSPEESRRSLSHA
ncbi:glutathione S-transferase family protein [Sphingopyxis sp.]|uniref:glutathione S-transferase family protein n=1 Tax=Sphingopyxis sp. TaxID=1908224 RepID=UPI002D76E8D3|nr:glutathione S-transferase family protein [Sphingopyxis sp.]HET6526385.1 glutathione S-transferase family protein [Sphingopyxis sp.]